MSSNNSDSVSAIAREMQFFTKAAHAVFPLPPVVIQSDSLPHSAEREKPSEAEKDEYRPIRLS